MKQTFKPLAMAAAVAAASAGYSGVLNAQNTTVNGIGDLALIPYYTVEANFQTGVHIINTSDSTQVVKLRFRRAADSMDALDINLVMSPRDEWTGNLNDDTGEMLLTTEDKTCTVPRASAGKPDGVFAFPDLYREVTSKLSRWVPRLIRAPTIPVSMVKPMKIQPSLRRRNT